MIEINISNTSTLVNDADLAAWVAAIQVQVHRDFAPAWGIDANLTISSAPEVSAYRVILKDDADDPNALGYHLLDNNIPEASIFCRPTIDDGDTVSSVLSHEILEMLADPLTTRMSGQWICEVCDPCESTGYLIDNVAVSNFVMPAYFGLSSAVRGYDFNGQLTSGVPAMLPGGYLMSFQNGQWQSTMARRKDGTIPYQAIRPGRSLFRVRAAMGAP